VIEPTSSGAPINPPAGAVTVNGAATGVTATSPSSSAVSAAARIGRAGRASTLQRKAELRPLLGYLALMQAAQQRDLTALNTVLSLIKAGNLDSVSIDVPIPISFAISPPGLLPGCWSHKHAASSSTGPAGPGPLRLSPLMVAVGAAGAGVVEPGTVEAITALVKHGADTLVVDQVGGACANVLLMYRDPLPSSK